MDAVSKINDFFLKPFDSCKKYVDNPEKVTFCQSLSFRARLVAQLIASIIALPVLFLVGLFEGLVKLGKGQSCKNAFAPLVGSLKGHALLIIPMSITGIFTTMGATQKVGEAMINCLK